MAFGSGNNSQQQQQSGNKPHSQHHHHHHHHRHQQQSSSSSSVGLGGGGASSSSSQQHHHHHHQQQQSTTSSTTQKCNLPLGSGGSGGGPGPQQAPPNLPPKNSTSSSSYYQQSDPHSHQIMFFQSGSSSNNNNSASSFNKSKQSFHIHHHHGQGGGGEGVIDERLGYNSSAGGGGQGHHHQQQQHVNSSSSMSQQQYNQQQQQHLFGVAGGGGAQHHHHNNNQQPNRDLTDHERLLLEQIRAKKASLLKEIAQLQDEIDCVSKELLFTHKESDNLQHPLQAPPPDLIQGNNPLQQPPLADIELDNLSEHSNNNEDITDSHHHHPQQQPLSQRQMSYNKIPSNSVLGSNNSSNSSSSASNSKERDRLKLMSLGCKKFNMDPKKGIEFLVENALLKKEDDMDIGMFLYRGEGLNKTAIGDYLGEKNDFNERVLKVFVGLHDFTDLILVQALRQFLWSFRLPGEAQKIDRMMECFAQRYCQNNPDIFTNTDTCYVLSFAIIMLNTSLHNPSVKDKPTVEQFISMNRGINNGGDLPRELLISLYNSIQSEPFKIPEDDGNDLMTTFFNPDKEGWLWKQGGRYKTWKRRWFILNDNCLYYFEFTTDKEPRGIIPLENVNVREIDDGGREKSRQRYCFELYATDGSEVIKACKTDSDGRVVEGKHAVYRMSAASSEERDSWVKALRQSISYSPFYEILRKSGGGGAGGTSSSSLRGGGGSSRLRME